MRQEGILAIEQVAIIPYTFEHTNFHDLKVGSTADNKNKIDKK
jgi:riboflavin synthase alpha subunit